jgi:hypothetical protein
VTVDGDAVTADAAPPGFLQGAAGVLDAVMAPVLVAEIVRPAIGQRHQQLVRENQLSRFGTVSLDGTKIHANASRHSALSYGHAEKIEAHLKAEVQELLALVEAADQSTVPNGVSLPDEIKRREDRLAAIATAKAKIEARMKERYEQERAEYEAKMAARAESAAATGKKSSGRPPTPPESGPRADDQINLTDEASRIMKVAGGGFEQCYAPKEVPLGDNAQAVVDTESMLILAPHVTQATNNKEPVEPMVEKVQANPEGLNGPETLLADTGYFSQKNVATCVAAEIKPLIAVKRDEHHPDWRERFTEPAPLAGDASPSMHSRPRPAARPMRCASRRSSRCSASSSR